MIDICSLSILLLFEGDCPNGKKAFENSIALPMFYELREEDIGYVVRILQKVMR